ncbi:hypothetical protein V5O48_011508 [Marasmius crinis-equi]|uniref:RING-type E3 ubiquitin transferase n=1 Tax=Marasmius crinis-equi TaxID=585013 RepID=A0ABR3F5D6_9AGAR
MAKGKSSATSGTRKKHLQKQAKKHAGPDEPPEPTKEKKEKGKGKKALKKEKEARPKVYIPPVKPAPVQPDPLETTGLARRLPPDLYVSLRSLSKKSAVTKGKSLEDLQSVWVDKVLKGENPEKEYVLVDMLPVWLHHLPSLFIHPERRIRFQTVTLHDLMLQIPAVREQIVFSLTESLDEDQISSIIGAWCIAMHDVERLVSNAAGEPWRRLFEALPSDKIPGIIQSLQSFVQRACLDPNGTYMYLNPPAPVAPPPPQSSKKNVGGPAGRLYNSRSETPDGESRSRADDVEENEQDRVARIRVGALGAIRWLLDNHSSISSSISFFNHPALWSSLYHAERAPFWDGDRAFGSGQPNVRRSAWVLLQSLLKALKGTTEPEQQEALLPTLSSAVLRSAWVEPDTSVQKTMWQPLLLFLKGTVHPSSLRNVFADEQIEFPQSWKIELKAETESDPDPESDSEDEEDPKSQIQPQPPRSSSAYAEFLQFLQLGCGGSPIQGYPTIVIILSTIPSEILTSTPSHSLDDFFEAFWAAVDGRALSSLQRAAASEGFLSALLECLVFLVRRNQRASLFPEASNAEEAVKGLIRGQLERVWAELVKGTSGLKVEGRVAGGLLCRTFGELEKIDEGLWESSWETLATCIKNTSTKAEAPTLVCSVLSTFIDPGQKAPEKVREAGRVLLHDAVKAALDELESAEAGSEKTKHTEVFIYALTSESRAFGEEVLGDSVFAERIDQLVNRNAYTLLSSSPSPSLLLAYLSSPLIPEEKRQVCWQGLLLGVSGSGHPETDMSRLLDAVEASGRFRFFRPKGDEMDEVVGRLLVEALGGSHANVVVLRRVLKNPEPIISETGRQGLLESLASSFALQVDNALHEKESAGIGSTFDVVLDLLSVVLRREQEAEAKGNALGVSVLPDIFVFAHLLSKCYEGSSSFGVALKIWEEWRRRENEAEVVYGQIKERLRVILVDVNSRVLPEHIIQACKFLEPHIYPLADILPTETELNEMLDGLPSDPIHQSLAVLEPLIPPSSMFLDDDTETYTPPLDARGHSLYARLVTALIHIVLEDRQTAKRNMWILRHLLAFSVYAEDLINFPAGSGRSPAFDRRAVDSELSELVVKVHQVVTYVLVTAGDETGVALDVLSGKAKTKAEGLAQFIVDVVEASKRTESVRDFRVLGRVLGHVFDDVEKEEAERWVVFARGIEKSAPNTAIAIISSINAFGSEPPRLERYRNELAANLTGVPPSKADTEGLMLLRKLAAVAPPVDSDVVFLPQQRAVNVIKTCQQWVSSDEEDGDVGEEVECAMTLIFAYLAPILQHVTGSHWAFMFDVVENNLENSVMSDDTTLVTLARTLRLIVLIRDLAATNKALRAEWQERESGVLTAVRDLATSQIDSEVPSAPASACRELVLSIVQNLPSQLVDHKSLPKMCHLLMDSSVDVQKMAYGLLRQAAKKRTEHLVVEAGVDTEDKFKAELPHELLVALQQQSADLNFEETDQEQNVFGYLLGWMLLFDLFVDTSLKVRSGYIEQLRDLDIISTRFIPTIFAILGLDSGSIIKAFKLGVWEVEEFHVSYYEPGESFSLPVLAAHLYYRSLLTVPSVIYSWVLDCTDVQLSSAIGQYTSTHFSPVLIKTELNNVKGAADLTGDENLSVKVASSVNEVAAAYSVDEHQLEIKIRIPSDWPLHRIEIKDTKVIGVDEKRWRAWILAMQQIMWAQNGRIADGLALFKKNVALHFEGQVECAICYSIISVMDGSLPKKKCKTCKNGFHAGCLFKVVSQAPNSPDHQAMIQTGLIQNAHSDLVTDASYDYYGTRLATCGLDQRIKVWQLDVENGTWSVEDDWKAHDAAVSKVSWAHPEFGPIIASSSFDRTVKIWEQTTATSDHQDVNGTASAQPSSRWVERAVLLDARGTVRAVEFAPHHFGLKLATISTDNFLRVYECLEQPSLTTWQLSEEVDVLSIPSSISNSRHSRAHTVALATPTQTHASLDGASASLVSQALLQQQTPAPTRPGLGNREADGGWCISWCKDRYWGEIIAAGCGINGLIKVIQLSPSRRPTTLLVLDPNVPPSPLAPPALPSKEGTSGSPSGGSPSQGPDAEQPTPHSVVSVSWAPSCGRSYHLIGTGSRDGRVRIWKVKAAIDHDDVDEMEEADAQDDAGWTATLVADHDDHKSSVGRVDWNITGTILSSAGNDGRIRLWKATAGGNIWRPAGTIGVEQNPDADQGGRGEDVDMQ